MAPPPSQKCLVPGCEYATPENIPTWDLLTQHLLIHQQSVHPPATPNVPPGGGTSHAKTAKKERPSITNQMSEEAWRFFLDEWSRYKRQTGLNGQDLLDELWNCMTDELRQLAFAEGGTANLATEDAMTKKIKSLAVISLHSSVHVINLHELRQQSDENVHAFAARVRGIAASCGLQKECPGCKIMVNYSEETCYHVVMAGLCDINMKEKALTQAMLETITDLNSLVKWCTAEESGRLTIPDSQLAPLRHRSTYKQLQKTKTCNNCGQKRHGDGSQQAKQKDCKAFGKTCSKCNKPNHYATVCRSISTTGNTNAITTEAVTEEFDAMRINSINLKGDAEENAPLRYMATNPPSRKKRATAAPASKSVLFTDAVTSTEVSTTKQTNEQSCLPDTPPPAYPLPQIVPTTPGHLAALAQSMKNWGCKTVNTIPLPHMLHDIHQGWVKSRPLRNPDLSLTIKLHLPSYREIGLTIPTFTRKIKNSTRSIRSPSVMDTGAQMSVCPISTLTELGIRPDTILPLQSRIEGASSEPISLIGGILVEVTGYTSEGRTMSCLQMMYVSRAVKRVYMSKDACIKLQVVPENFPLVGSCPPETNQSESSLLSPINSNQKPSVPPPQTKCTNTGIIEPGTEECTCPSRSLPPADTPTLPCEPTEDNLPILKAYILNRYSASAFNTCQKQPLPLMTGSPPLRLYVDPKAKPVAAHTPAQVPLHWQDAVKGGLDRDVRLGVLEKVKVNEPVEWCSRMVIQPKPSGEPRRVVDYQALNSHAPRQTHHTETPWSLVSSVPAKQVKTVLDCWHGYHSVPIAEADRPLTTFLTPYGRYQYKTVPQGFISAGDGYTHRMEGIIGDFPRIKKCIDDNLIYDEDITTNFFRVCDFLTKCSSQGCIFNPEKFQFGEQTVQFLGFMVTPDSIRPTDDFLQNILSFPTPQTITDIRSWYGAVAQISYAFATAPEMLPFRHLLSTKAPFQWSPDLEKAFKASKDEIVRQCMTGVRNFDPNLPTALATDWSKLAMGHWLCQKHCECEATKPGCCPTGWQTVFVGSRFCSPAESRYAPIEGEAASAIWALDKCKFFLLGMPDFILAMDHKPLISLLGKQEFMTIPNPRLMGCKIKSQMYTFTPTYIPGKLHVVPDCLSRRSDSPIPPATRETPVLDISNVSPEYQDTCSPPSWVSQPLRQDLQQTDNCPGNLAAISLHPTPDDQVHSDEVDLLLIGNIMSALAAIEQDAHQLPVVAPVRLQPSVLSYSRLQAAATTCPVYSSLRSLLQSGPPEDKTSWPVQLLPYYKHRHALLVVGQVVLLHDRPVIPVALRTEVMEHLHGAHGCVTSMYARAVTCVFWPNMREDIVLSRAACSSCNLNAPSNPAQPPHPIQHPEFPFSDICADFFQYSSKSYLVIVDRYSNWLSLYQLPDDNSANAIKTFRTYFATWGIPQTLSTDGDPIFTSQEMETWLKRWDVHHRVSSAYFPRSNKRAEVAVKSGKRMIMDNVGPGGTLATDRIARALLQHRNCPDSATGLSSAQVVFGRVLKDHLPFKPGSFSVRREWRLQADLREQALAKRHHLKDEQLKRGSRALPALSHGDFVMIQDQANPKQPGKWTKTGKVVEVQEFDSYLVKVDGSNRVTKRNRQFLRKFVPFINAKESSMPAAPPTTSLQIHPNRPVMQTRSAVIPKPHLQKPKNVTPTKTNDNLIPPSPRKPAHLREKWIVATPVAHPTSPPSPVYTPTSTKTIVNNFSDETDDSVTDNEAPFSTDARVSTVSPPPILLPNFTPELPGTSHNYEAMAREAAKLREQVARSRQSPT